MTDQPKSAESGNLAQVAQELKLGKTGTFPEGKLNQFDEGGLRFAVGEEKDKVVINFGTPVSFVALGPAQAVQLAGMIIAHARSAARLSGIPLTVPIKG